VKICCRCIRQTLTRRYSRYLVAIQRANILLIFKAW
jgi:hypothetical protein